MKKFPAKIFIDGGDPQETKQAKQLLGFLNGQTTNPTLIAKNLKEGLEGRTLQKLTYKQALEEYKRIVQEMSKIIPQGSVSIQIFADKETKAKEILKQARERSKWIPNFSIKIPCTFEGLKAAEIVCKEMPINITLAFSQSQAAAVYQATKGAKYPVFISPFVGRLDDRGENGMDVVANILKMYEEGDSHVEVLTASVRNLGHIIQALELKSNIITIPFRVFREWVDTGFKMTLDTPERGSKPLAPIPYQQNITLGKPWQDYYLHHELTDIGIERFSADWNALID